MEKINYPNWKNLQALEFLKLHGWGESKENKGVYFHPGFPLGEDLSVNHPHQNR